MHYIETDIRSRLLVARLPAMPQILLKLLEHCQNDDAGMPELAALIAQDPAITSKIFAVANSSAFHRSGVKPGLEQALTAIGTEMVKTLVISESVFQMFNNVSQPGAPDLRSFWKHSLTAAVLAREIALKMQYAHLEEAYLAGLLHDIGRLALLTVMPAEYGASFLAADDTSLCAVEQRTLQLTHAEAGAWMIERWELDSFLADSVLYHHESPARLANAHPLIRIVLLAHLMSSLVSDDPGVVAAAVLCGIDPATLNTISTRAAAQVYAAAEHLGIDLAGAEEGQPAIMTPAPAEDPVRQRLSDEMRNMVLASNLGRTFSGRQSEAALLETVLGSARILFGFVQIALLQMDAQTQTLIGIPTGANQQRLSAFSLQSDSDSRIADAVRTLQPVYVRRAGKLLSVAEEQLLRMFGTSALVVVPLVTAGVCRAVLVGGISQIDLPELEQRERFLKTFAAQASSALADLDHQRQEGDQRLASVAAQYRDASRQVAHEVNNPLAIIKNYLSVLDTKLLRQQPVTAEISILNEEIDRVGQIVNGLADLQPVLQANPPGGDVNQIVASVVRLFQHAQLAPESVQILTRLEEHAGDIAASADLVRQIIMNLLKNAVEAMPDAIGGTIELTNHGVLHREGRLYLELSVRDNGPGIPADILATLYTPGRSTKPGPHRGQGLSIVQTLVRQVDGFITCRSNQQGTRFELLLPIPKPEKIAVDRGAPGLHASVPPVRMNADTNFAPSGRLAADSTGPAQRIDLS